MRILLKQIKRWGMHPAREDEDEYRTVRLLDVTILTLLVYTSLIFLSTAVGGRILAGGFIATAVTFATSLIFRFLLFRGKTLLVGVGLIALGIFAITLSVASNGTVRTPVLAPILFR